MYRFHKHYIQTLHSAKEKSPLHTREDKYNNNKTTHTLPPLGFTPVARVQKHTQ